MIKQKKLVCIFLLLIINSGTKKSEKREKKNKKKSHKKFSETTTSNFNQNQNSRWAFFPGHLLEIFNYFFFLLPFYNFPLTISDFCFFG